MVLDDLGHHDFVWQGAGDEDDLALVVADPFTVDPQPLDGDDDVPLFRSVF